MLAHRAPAIIDWRPGGGNAPYVGGLGISHVTTHVALSDACRLISKERVLQVLRLTHAVRVQLGQISKPIAVAGLNPHSGEGGLLAKRS